MLLVGCFSRLCSASICLVVSSLLVAGKWCFLLVVILAVVLTNEFNFCGCFYYYHFYDFNVKFISIAMS